MKNESGCRKIGLKPLAQLVEGVYLARGRRGGGEAFGMAVEKGRVDAYNFSTDIVGAMNAGIDTAFFNRHPDTFTAPSAPTREVHRLEELNSWL